MTDGPDIFRDDPRDDPRDAVRAVVDEPDLPLAETDVKSAARTCSVILLVIAGVVAIALVALVIALING